MTSKAGWYATQSRAQRARAHAHTRQGKCTCGGGLAGGAEPYDSLALGMPKDDPSLTRREIDGWPGYPLPEPAAGIAANLAAARLTNPGVRLAGVAVNTSHLSEADARAALDRLATDLGAPAIDALRFGAASIVDTLSDWRT